MGCRRSPVLNMGTILAVVQSGGIVPCLKAKLYAISSDTHQLQLIKLRHFKLEIFKSIQ